MWLTVGIVEKGHPGCKSKIDSLYTETFCFGKWIYETTGEKAFKHFAEQERICGDGSLRKSIPKNYRDVTELELRLERALGLLDDF